VFLTRGFLRLGAQSGCADACAAIASITSPDSREGIAWPISFTTTSFAPGIDFAVSSPAASRTSGSTSP